MNAIVALSKTPHVLGRIVGRAVVHEDEFGGVPGSFDGALRAMVELEDVRG
jgi:hypothetical protein